MLLIAAPAASPAALATEAAKLPAVVVRAVLADAQIETSNAP
jgi:hypothetical protein